MVSIISAKYSTVVDLTLVLVHPEDTDTDLVRLLDQDLALVTDTTDIETHTEIAEIDTDIDPLQPCYTVEDDMVPLDKNGRNPLGVL